MALSNVNTAWKNDLYPLVTKTFDYQYENFMNMLSPIVSEEDSNSVDYRLEGLGGYGELPDYDGAQLTGMNQKRGFVTIITPREKAGSIDISYKAAKIDKLGETKKVGTRAARSAAMTVYMTLLRMFGNAFNPAQVGGDGKPWAAIDHPVASKADAGGVSVADPDAGTFSNIITGNPTLSVNAITKAQTLANRLVTPDGMAFACNMDTLLVSPELEPKAKEICGGPDKKLMPEKLPESAENGANPVYGMGYIVVGGGADGFSEKQWAVCDRALLAEICKIIYITRPTVMRTELDNPLIDRYVPYVDFSTGFADARPIFFSNP